MSDKLEEYRRKVAGTNIDPRSLLSTDYFNTFNSVVMLLEMLPDCPELIDDVYEWKFSSYVEHFENSGLDFAPLAIEAYAHAPANIREAFERKIESMRIFIEDSVQTMRHLCENGEMEIFSRFAQHSSMLFRGMIEEGSGIVHGRDETLAQSDIDKMF